MVNSLWSIAVRIQLLTIFYFLFDLLVKRHFLHYRIVLFQLDALGGILTVFGGDVSACAGQPCAFVFCAFQNHLFAHVNHLSV